MRQYPAGRTYRMLFFQSKCKLSSDKHIIQINPLQTQISAHCIQFFEGIFFDYIDAIEIFLLQGEIRLPLPLQERPRPSSKLVVSFSWFKKRKSSFGKRTELSSHRTNTSKDYRYDTNGNTVFRILTVDIVGEPSETRRRRRRTR